MHLHRDPNLGGIYLALGQSIVIGAAELRPGRQSAIGPTRRVSLSACGWIRFESLVAFLELMEEENLYETEILNRFLKQYL